MRSIILPAIAAAVVLSGCARASTYPESYPDGLPLEFVGKKTGPAISVLDLMSRLYLYADDSMQGRAFGLKGNAKATAYIAAEVARMGLEPAGDSGTYFQTVPVALRVISPNSSLSVAGRKLALWEEWTPRDQQHGSRLLTAVPIVYGGAWADSLNRIDPAEVDGKIVVFSAGTGADGKPAWEVNRGQATNRYRTAAAVIIGNLDVTPPDIRLFQEQPTVRVGTIARDTARVPAFIYVTARVLREIVGGDPAAMAKGSALPPIEGGVAFTNEPPEGPSRNVVAVLRGSDPTVRNQFVAIGAHNDHIGFGEPVDHDSLRAYNTVVRPGGVEGDDGRAPTAEETTRIRTILDSLRAIRRARPDSIGNGADDDASGTVAVLELAEMMARLKERPRRSILFVWHTGEEAGLLGSDWFTRNPTVARDSIVAQLNIDMVGRGGALDIANGGPNYLQLIGSRRLSRELGDIVERRNLRNGHKFVFDYQFDANGHPQQFYCRSDHYMYARYGIPIVFFTTGGHRDYHMVTDEPQYIDYVKLRRVTLLVGDIAMHVANMANRPVVDGPKPDPNGECQQ